jgi:hypothetical protein
MLLYSAPTAVSWTADDLARRAFAGVVGGVVLAGIALLGRWCASRVGLPIERPNARHLARSLVIAVPAAVAILTAHLTMWFLYAGEISQQGVLRIAVFLGLDPRYTLGRLVASVGAAIVEEVLFRVLVMSVVAWLVFLLTRRRTLALAVGLVVSTVLFAGSHGLALEIVALHIPAGLLFGVLYVRRGVESAILAHAAVNVGAFMLATAVAPLFV